jgi:methylmalonyl-CoA mutase C-terminal domain/subunit
MNTRPTTAVRNSGTPAPKRLLLAKTGLDCHDTGIITVAQKLREAGYEVIYLGLHNHPGEVVKAAVQEGVDGIGVSYLSGQHMTQMRRLLDAMRAENLRVPVFCGGVIPASDAADLRALGVAAVIPPGTLTNDLLAIVAGVLEPREPPTAATG